MHRNFLQLQLVRRAPPHVAHGDNALRVHDDGLPPAELGNARRNFVDGRLSDLPRVLGVRDDLVDIPPFDIECRSTIVFPSLNL
jgi:hypothetical protein